MRRREGQGRPGEAQGAGGPGEGTVRLCTFQVGDEEYALDVMRVREILPPPHVTPLPGAPAFVEGVVNLRGALLPVVDLRRRLLGPGAPPPRRSRMLVCLLGRRRLALMVDQVGEVLRVRLEDIRPAPHLGPPGARPFVVGVCGPPERLRLLLDIKALLVTDAPG